jgi:hypothetical protein
VKGSILKQSKTENNDRILDYREETKLSTRSYMYNKLYIQKHKKTEYKMIVTVYSGFSIHNVTVYSGFSLQCYSLFSIHSVTVY